MSAFLAVGAVANVALLILVVGIVLAKRRGARLARSAGAAGQFERAAQRRYLVENWSTIEKISVERGMSAAELEEVKRRLFDLEAPS